MTDDAFSWKNKTHILPWVDAQPWVAKNLGVASTRSKKDNDAEDALIGEESQDDIVYLESERSGATLLEQQDQDREYEDNSTFWEDSVAGTALPVTGGVYFEAGVLDGDVIDGNML